MCFTMCIHYKILFSLQTTIIQSATTSDPNAWWWIKGDGVDVVKGLCESTKGEWSGDVDLNDGQLQLLQQQLHEWIKGIGMKERSAREVIKSDLLASINNSTTDLQFIHSGTVIREYLKKVISVCLCHYIKLQSCRNPTRRTRTTLKRERLPIKPCFLFRGILKS